MTTPLYAGLLVLLLLVLLPLPSSSSSSCSSSSSSSLFPLRTSIRSSVFVVAVLLLLLPLREAGRGRKDFKGDVPSKRSVLRFL